MQMARSVSLCARCALYSSLAVSGSSVCSRCCFLGGCLRRDTLTFAFSVVVVGGFSRSSNCLSVRMPLYQSALKIFISLVRLVHSLARLVVPFGNLTSPIASFGHVVESLAKFAPVAPRLLAVDAHIEELAVLRIGVPRVRRADGNINFRTSKLEQL